MAEMTAELYVRMPRALKRQIETAAEVSGATSVAEWSRRALTDAALSELAKPRRKSLHPKAYDMEANK